jgi:CRISPR-associated protein Csx17
VARGLSGFSRYGYLERNGQSKIAVPLGRIVTGERAHAYLVDDVGSWLDSLQRVVRDGDETTRFAVVEGGLADAVFNALSIREDARYWQAILIAAARLEAVQASGTALKAGPLPRLSGGWLDAACDDSPEWRLAVALGSAAAEYSKMGRPTDSVRVHALPLAKGRFATTAEKRLVNDPRVVMSGRDPMSDLAALVERRIVEATARGQRVLPLIAQPCRGAQLADLAAFLDGSVDVQRVVWLARALMAVHWGPTTALSSRPARRDAEVDEGWMALRLCGLPFSVADRRAPIELAMVRRLTSGDVSGAVSIALRRLCGVGFRPPLLSATADRTSSLRWAAALAFPVDPVSAVSMAARFQNHANRLQH